MTKVMIVEQLSIFNDKFEEFFSKTQYPVYFDDFAKNRVDKWLSLFKERKFQELAEVDIIIYNYSNQYYFDAFKAKIGVEKLPTDLDRGENRQLFISQLETAYQRIVS